MREYIEAMQADMHVAQLWTSILRAEGLHGAQEYINAVERRDCALMNWRMVRGHADHCAVAMVG
jgi:hypothetical protein